MENWIKMNLVKPYFKLSNLSNEKLIQSVDLINKTLSVVFDEYDIIDVKINLEFAETCHI